MTLEWTLARMFPRSMSPIQKVMNMSYVPDVSCKMFAACEAEVAWWVVGTVESLALLLLGRSALTICIFTIGLILCVFIVGGGVGRSA